MHNKLFKLLSLISCSFFFYGFNDFSTLERDTLYQEEVEKALQAKFAFQINLKDNTATYFENGIPKDTWAVATGDISGTFHDGEQSPTPSGIYNVQRMVYCPNWNPGKIKNKATGDILTSKEDRYAYFAQNPETFGACGSKNPLGNFVIWFQQPYGLHGNSNEEVLERADPESRRVSGGCVRNPNNKIAEIFKRILSKSPSMAEFYEKIEAEEALEDKVTMARNAAHLGIKVVIGEWGDRDKKLIPQGSFELANNSDEKNIFCTVKKSPSLNARYPVDNQLVNLPSSIRRLKILGNRQDLYKTYYGWLNKDHFKSCKVIGKI